MKSAGGRGCEDAAQGASLACSEVLLPEQDGNGVELEDVEWGTEVPAEVLAGGGSAVAQHLAKQAAAGGGGGQVRVRWEGSRCKGGRRSKGIREGGAGEGHMGVG